MDCFLKNVESAGSPTSSTWSFSRDKAQEKHSLTRGVSCVLLCLNLGGLNVATELPQSTRILGHLGTKTTAIACYSWMFRPLTYSQIIGLDMSWPLSPISLSFSIQPVVKHHVHIKIIKVAMNSGWLDPIASPLRGGGNHPTSFQQYSMKDWLVKNGIPRMDDDTLQYFDVLWVV